VKLSGETKENFWLQLQSYLLGRQKQLYRRWNNINQGIGEKGVNFEILKILKNTRNSWTGHTIRHNEFVVNILEGAIFGKKMPWEDLDCSA